MDTKNKVSYTHYFSKRGALIRLIGICLLAIFHYFNYYTFVILSERLNVFTIQQRNYTILLAKIFGRIIMFFILVCATRRFFNFFISISVFAFSFLMFLLSYMLELKTLDIVGLVFTSKSLYFVMESPCVSCREFHPRAHVPVCD